MAGKINKIEDIPKLKSIKDDLEGMELLKDYSFLFPLLGINPDGLNDVFDKLPSLKEKIEKLLIIPNKFNSLFASNGWIAHESMNFDLMIECVDYAENDNFQLAEKKLADHFCSDDIKYKLYRFNAFPELKIRYNMIIQASENTLQGNYISAVPLLLIIIDGIVNDIDKNKGFFASDTEMTAWDSIAAHKSGLGVIRDVFNRSRKKTTINQIELPYRNGILHGRDLGFGNKIVTGKCWSTLIAIYDWITVKNNKGYKLEKKRELALSENLESLLESIEELERTRKESEEISVKVKNWKPRNIVIGKDIPLNGKPDDYKEFSPEKEVVQFLEYWEKSNYGYIAKQIRHFEDPNPDIKKTAGEIREILSEKNLQSFQINSVVDVAPSISEVSIRVNYRMFYKNIQKDMTFRLTCIGKNGETTVNGDKDNYWRFYIFILRDQLT